MFRIEPVSGLIVGRDQQILRAGDRSEILLTPRIGLVDRHAASSLETHQWWLHMASRIMIGIGTPSSQSRIERPMRISPKLQDCLADNRRARSLTAHTLML